MGRSPLPVHTLRIGGTALINILQDPVFRVTDHHHPHTLTLPEVLEALGRDAVDHFLGLQGHQQDAVHVFLSYLAATILARRHETIPRQPADFWLSGFRALARRPDDDAWTLVVANQDHPAFLQPPVLSPPALSPEKYPTPDALDVLNSSQNHEIKKNRASHAYPDEWIYALITLQMMSPYLGQGTSAISRMYANQRLIVEVTDNLRYGPRWSHAVTRLLAYRPTLLREPYLYRDDGVTLTWVPPWPVGESLSLRELDPFYIDISRRIRLVATDTGCQALKINPTNDNTPRIAAKTQNGNLGDAWIPVNIDPGPKNNLPHRALSTEKVDAAFLQRILFERHVILAPLQRPERAWQESLYFIISLLIRGKNAGQTDGFSRTVLRIPAPAQHTIFGPVAQRDLWGDYSARMINDAQNMQRILKTALMAYLEAGPEQLQRQRQSIRKWRERAMTQWTAQWQTQYFSHLWTAIDKNSSMRTAWQEDLAGFAVTVLNQAERTWPTPANRYYRSCVVAHNTFDRQLATTFPDLTARRRPS